MTVYSYALHTDDGPNEYLGFIDIRTDHEAINFGQEVVDDILLVLTPTQNGVTLEVTEGSRHVGSVPLAAEVRRKAYG